MDNNNNLEKLHFLTAGMPLSTPKNGSYESAFTILKELNLDGLEMEFVHGVRISSSKVECVKKLRENANLILTAHAPFYINLNSKEEDKVDASVIRILDTYNVAKNVNAYSITFHAAYYMNNEKEKVYNQVESQIAKIINLIESQQSENKVWIRPETTGKPTQWGDLDEIIRLSKTFKNYILPCVDFSHLHARTNGKFNSYKEFANVFEKIGNELGDCALNNFHAHIAGILYGEKGEKSHIELENSDMNYKDLLKAFFDFKIKGVIVCESPNIEDDAILLKNYYLSL